ncbi:retropepsin-like aspartic protease [Fibrobacter intestinalis]|uniref:Aspartyl protease n=1 Tax=Fibrobacter intestinalis TaxID=28122 RepID=A0A1T4RNL6_9BACT|nr:MULTISPECIES: retropepsin-like aspartic protease [Fibrobacter]PBC72461.1 gag-polyprotein putative aspartyl protease [Fibrobacter sp. NR9]PBC73026.1 gag-polyprotein putative aspartyl protease [Fibrobacter sp. NR9]SKA17533.1 Aspartyl protease [Fibrobacter intestinalis]
MPLVITESFNLDTNLLCSPCLVYDPLTGNSCHAKAIWDTGATLSCISPNIAKTLNLSAVGTTTNHTANGSTASNKHIVDIAIGNIRFQKIAVTAPPLPDDFVLIGMDLIGLGKFTVQNMNENGEVKKVLTLELP